jgi:hypothetical protein
MSRLRPSSARGTVILVSLCFVAVLGIALTTYMVLCTKAMNLSGRSGLKSTSEQLAELGLEEALRALNNNDFNDWTSGSNPNQIASNWSTSGTTASCTLTFPSSQYGSLGVSGTVNLKVYNYSSVTTYSPWDANRSYTSGNHCTYLGRVYTCTADNSNTLPTNTGSWSDITPYVYAEGVAVLPDSAGTTVRTQLRADFGIAPVFPNAIAGTSTSASNYSVNFASNGTIDSYDSSQGTYNQTSSPFSAASPNQSYSAIVAGPYVYCQSSSTIKGFVSSTNFSYVGSAVVKSAISAVSPKVDNLRVTTSYNIPQPSISMPGSSSLPSTAAYNSDPSNYPTTLRTGTTSIGAVGSTTTCAITRTYDGSSFTSGIYLFNASDVLKIYGNVILDVTGDLYTYYGLIDIQPNSSLTIRFTGELYLGSFTSPSGIRNQSNGLGVAGDPKKCLIYGTNGYGSGGYPYLWSSTPFYGTIYMPSTYVTIWSGVTYYGAITAQTVYFPYTANFHYDTSLRTADFRIFKKKFYVTTWRELTDPAERITLP